MGDIGPAFIDQLEFRDPDIAISVSLPGLGSADNLQVSGTTGTQSPQHAAGDTERTGPGQEVVPSALPSS